MSSDKTPVTACVIGLGRAGLPHAMVAADSGNVVWGYDLSEPVIKQLENKQTPFFEPDQDEILDRVLNQTFFPTADLKKAFTESELIVILIGLPLLQPDHALDSSNLFATIDQLIQLGLRGKTILLRSTLAVGITDLVREQIERESGLKCDVDFHLAYCPERLAEGCAVKDERETPKIIGAYCDAAYEIINQYFQNFGGPIILVSSVRTAELVKLIDNSYRSTIFAFANDIALVSEQVQVNAVEAINAANQNYSRNSIPLPSSGVSGYCLTKDPYILEAAFEPVQKTRGFGSTWYYARLANDYMPRHVAEMVKGLLQDAKQEKGSRGLICGITFKENVDDSRFSHGLEICDYLTAGENSAQLSIYDPFVDNEKLVAGLPPQMKDSVTFHSNINEAFKGQNFVVFTVKHDEFVKLKGERIVELVSTMIEPRIVMDGWNIFPELKGVPGIIYRGIGNA